VPELSRLILILAQQAWPTCIVRKCELAEIHFAFAYQEVCPNLIESFAKSFQSAQRLQQLRGVGPIIATLVAAPGDGTAFRKGWDFAVSLGLTPKPHNSGGKAHLLGISKRGDAYVRQLMVHGLAAQ
jgi:transposase